jgi:hypothetical protein
MRSYRKAGCPDPPYVAPLATGPAFGHSVMTIAEWTWAEAAEFFQRGPQAGRDGEGNGGRRRSEGEQRVAPSRNRYSVPRSKSATEQNRRQLGPTILFDRPRQGAPHSSSSIVSR